MGSLDGESTGDGILSGGERFSRNHGESGTTTASKWPARRSAALCSAVASTLLCASASAQGVLEEIVVTAQKREQNIQNVPIAISAFTTETLRAKGVTDINACHESHAERQPGRELAVLGRHLGALGLDPRHRLRTTSRSTSTRASVCISTACSWRARSARTRTCMDVDRVEILKGPQGTLFGRNTIGGAINIVTHVPGPEPRFEAQATVGSYNRTRPRIHRRPADHRHAALEPHGVVDRSRWVPGRHSLSGRLALGSTPFIVDPMNAYPRAGFDTSDANGGLNQTVVRGKLLWQASDDVEVTFAAD